jgi:hypothetical protein
MTVSESDISRGIPELEKYTIQKLTLPDMLEEMPS